jgi:hypothetical protein
MSRSCRLLSVVLILSLLVKNFFFYFSENFGTPKIGPALSRLSASYNSPCRSLSVVLILSLLVKNFFFIFLKKNRPPIFGLPPHVAS